MCDIEQEPTFTFSSFPSLESNIQWTITHGPLRTLTGHSIVRRITVSKWTWVDVSSSPLKEQISFFRPAWLMTSLKSLRKLC